MPDVVFISSLSHSGSTLLEILIGRHPEAFPVGEAFQFFGPNRDTYLANADDTLCSCLRTLNQCSFWSEVIPKIKTDKLTRYRDFHLQAYPAAAAINSAFVAWIDSSKYTVALRELVTNDTEEPRVIFLSRDVRGWCASIASKEKRDFFRYWRIMSTWKQATYDILDTLDGLRLRNLHITYEDLCLDTQNVLATCYRFAGLGPADPSRWSAQADLHIGLGNDMRHQRLSTLQVRYDDRWFSSPLIQFLYLARPGIRRANEEVARRSSPYAEEDL